jgi:predicted PurR-regulated permease PerM
VPTPPSITKNSSSSTQLLAVITAVVVIAGLYLGKDLIIPFALALLLSFLLSTPVGWLERLRLGRPFSVVTVLVATFLLAGALIWLGLQQLSGMAFGFPEYRAHILRKMEMLRNPASAGVVSSLENLTQLADELAAREIPENKPAPSDGAGQMGKPMGPKREVHPLPIEIVKTQYRVFLVFRLPQRFGDSLFGLARRGRRSDAVHAAQSRSFAEPIVSATRPGASCADDDCA